MQDIYHGETMQRLFASTEKELLWATYEGAVPGTLSDFKKDEMYAVGLETSDARQIVRVQPFYSLADVLAFRHSINTLSDEEASETTITYELVTGEIVLAINNKVEPLLLKENIPSLDEPGEKINAGQTIHPASEYLLIGEDVVPANIIK